MSWRRFLNFVLVSSFGMFSLVSPVYAESEGQEKLLAKRAAQADAYRNLAERVYGLQIDAETYVRDFAAESDQIRTDLDTFLKGARVTNVRYLPDGTCEVEVEITLQEIVPRLEKAKESWDIFGRWKKVEFNKIYDYVDSPVISVVGYGVPPESGESIEASEYSQEMPSPTSGIPGWEGVTPRGRLMAQRASLTDAYRNMAEQIKGLRIDSQTYVRDFVADSDQVNTYLDAFIKGIRPAGQYRYTPLGICEVDVEVTVEEIVKELTIIRKKIRGWNTIRYKTIVLEEILDYTPAKVIRVTGAGVPPEKYKEKGGNSSVRENVPAWASSSLKATGTGVAPDGSSGTEARVMAERAAEVEARRNLAEQVYGVHIDSTTTVKDFIVKHDEITADLDTFINGAEIVDRRYFSDNSVEVDVELPLSSIWEAVSKY